MFCPSRLWQSSWNKLLPRTIGSLVSLAFAAAVASADGGTVLRDGWKIQSSAKVSAAAERVSTVGFSTEGWYSTSAPKTVFAVLVENGVYKDPYFGMNLRTFPGVDYKIGGQFANEEMQPNSPYAVPWWYRKEFEIPASERGKRIWLAFRGINYRADIWINGRKLAGSDTVVGAFRRYEFDVTDFVKAGSKNAVAVSVSAPHAAELGITWVDWNPTPPDKDMGLWQEVILSSSGSVTVRHATVETKLNLPKADFAHLTVRAEVTNATAAPVKGTVRGSLEGQGGPIEFSQSVELAGNEKKEVVFSPETTAPLNLYKARLWWPFQMGEPHLNRLKLQFVMADAAISDSIESHVGLVQTDSELTPEGYRLLKINGKPILIRGGGWAPDMMLRVDESRREAEFRYVKEMGLNTIRLEGKLEDESFLERADRDGILVMAGWCCCDAWEKWGKWGEENKQVSVNSLRDQLLRLRAHPSMLMWLNGSDNPPPHDREVAYLDVEKEIHWNKPVISSATAKETDVTGKSGVKMSGPYDYVPADYWFVDTKAGGAYGFNTETSPGPAVPPVEELKTFIPEDKLWPINDVWNFHAGGGKFKNIELFSNALEKRYGAPNDVNDFAWKSQAMTYEGERAMFEAYGRNKYKSTGIIQWMLNNAWPGLIWHLYSYDLRPAGGYFGSKKALELIHVQFNLDDRMVAVVNGTQSPQTGLKVVAKLYDLSMNETFSREADVAVDADGVARSFAIPEPADISSTYFLNLQLVSAAGQIISRNFYWLSTKPDVLNFEKTEWYYTPQTGYADFSALQTLAPASVKALLKPAAPAGHDAEFQVTLENTGKNLAFLVHLRLTKGKDAAEILPVFWEDNYISLLPGERREVQVRLRKSDLGPAQPDLIVDGFNAAPHTIHISR
ncbi:MAG: glycosyl hydrolase family 2 [Acidobacteria bacterium]|nr:glycosyl hydrolase family 2 [Acidobacteriota bacterium]MBS1864658.1 glycosyl hydrolase family 2 [Acidobacteriota bacterium]